MSIKCWIGIHDWSVDCAECSRCGKARANAHDWNGCKCRTCGCTRDEGHDWNGCKCQTCGRTRDEGHDWSADSCRRCLQTRVVCPDCQLEFGTTKQKLSGLDLARRVKSMGVASFLGIDDPDKVRCPRCQRRFLP